MSWRMGKLVSGWVVGRMNGWMTEWMGKLVRGWVVGCLSGWVVGWLVWRMADAW